MPFFSDPPRQVIPRWRSFQESSRRGELVPIVRNPQPAFTQELIDSQIKDWNDAKTMSVAADLVSSAFTLSLNEVAVDAARFVIESADAPLPSRRLAQLYLDRREEGQGPNNIVVASDSNVPLSVNQLDCQIEEIHRIRLDLREYPRNPLQWTNLALLYTSIGALEKAELAIRIAMQLAPNDRHVLRTASRFYLHLGQRDRAHHILSKSPRLQGDPWIMAGEIAIADTMRRTSRHMKRAKRWIESDRFEHFQSSELASAVGTIELKAGSGRRGRRIVEASLRDPSENALAQATWVARAIDNRIELPELSESPEAAAFKAAHAGRWTESLRETTKWFLDQRFSSRPAILGSFIAATAFEEFEQAKLFAEAGLRANPGDLILSNNLAFSHAMSGEIIEANAAISALDHLDPDSAEAILVNATRGLIAFRAGQPDEGRRLYNAAIRGAKAKQLYDKAAQATVYLAIEECRIHSAVAPQAAAEARKALDQLLPGMKKIFRHLLDEHCGAGTIQLEPRV